MKIQDLVLTCCETDPRKRKRNALTIQKKNKDKTTIEESWNLWKSNKKHGRSLTLNTHKSWHSCPSMIHRLKLNPRRSRWIPSQPLRAWRDLKLSSVRCEVLSPKATRSFCKQHLILPMVALSPSTLRAAAILSPIQSVVFYPFGNQAASLAGTEATALASSAGSQGRSGDVIYLKSQNTGRHIDIESASTVAQTRWDDQGLGQRFKIEKKNAGVGAAINAGDQIFLIAHNGNTVDIESKSLRARWTNKLGWETITIEKTTAGAINHGDTVYLRAWTNKHVDVSGTSVQVIEKIRSPQDQSSQSIKSIKSIKSVISRNVYSGALERPGILADADSAKNGQRRHLRQRQPRQRRLCERAVLQPVRVVRHHYRALTQAPTPGGVWVDYETFKKAVAAGAAAIGKSAPEPSQETYNYFMNGAQSKSSITSRTELAMFLTHLLKESDFLRAVSEYKCANPNDCAGNYGGVGGCNWDAAWPNIRDECNRLGLTGRTQKQYFGRGYIQTTWIINYHDTSKALYDDLRLVDNPELLSQNKQVAWDSSFYYWKSRVHGSATTGQFGATTKAINGGEECNSSMWVANCRPQHRFQMYAAVARTFGVQSTLDASGCRSDVSDWYAWCQER
eukprot:g60793.t1